MSYKAKTQKTASKRFKITSTGKIMRGHAYSSHLKNSKSGSRKRRQKEPIALNKANSKTMGRLIKS